MDGEPGEPLRAGAVYIPGPAAPHRRQTRAVGHVVKPAQLVLQLVGHPVPARAAACEAVVGEAPPPHHLRPGLVVLRLLCQDPGTSITVRIRASARLSVRAMPASGWK